MRVITGLLTLLLLLSVIPLCVHADSGDADLSSPITKLEDIVMSKLRSNVRVRVSDQKKKSSNIQTFTDKVILTMSFENGLKRPLEELQIVACVIGKPFNSSKKEPNKIVATNELKKVRVAEGKTGSLVILKADITAESRSNSSNSKKNRSNQRNRRTWNSGYRYESYFVVVKDSTGDVIQLKAKDSRARKFALTNPATGGPSLGLNAEMQFDRNGNRIAKK